MKKFIPFFVTVFLSLTIPGQNPYLIDAGFENLPVGVNTSTGWINSTAYSVYNSQVCGAAQIWTVNNVYSIVKSTPFTDPVCGEVTKSPFAGNKVIGLNYIQGNLVGGFRTLMKQSFQVNNSNFIYRYAYEGVLDAWKPLCDGSYLIFNFFDCNNQLISALSKTIVANPTYNMNPDAANWTLASISGIAHTPNWVMRTANLLPYIGTCVTVEVNVSPCTCGSGPGYIYYDCESNDNFIQTSGYTIPNANTYVSCTGATTLSGTSGFSSYLWQGPPNSGISGATSQAITASVSGVYSLAVTSGTFNANRTITMTLSGAAQGLSVSANSATTCVGGSVTIQALGSALTSYTWNTGSNAAFISVSPTLNTTYSVYATNSLGCNFYDSKSIQLLPSPQLVQITSPVSAICPGTSVLLNAVGSANTSYTWSTGSNNSSLSASPAAATIYTVSATNTLGCVSSATTLISLFPVTPVQINLSSLSICAYQPASLSLAAQGIVSYTWSTGFMNQVLSVNPAVTSVYSVVGTNINGCNSSTSATLNVLPLPTVQIVSSSTSSTTCSGQSIFLSAVSSANNSFYWNTGSTLSTISATPFSNTSYQVTVTDPSGCASMTSIAITVMPLPQVDIQSAKNIVCEGESITLYAAGTGIATYIWSTGGTGQSLIVTPVVSPSFYNVTVTDNSGCSSTAQKMVDITTCTGINGYAVTSSYLLVFPNPASDSFVVKGSKDESGIIFNAVGQQVNVFSLNPENNFSQTFNGFASGIYFVKTTSNSTKLVVK